MPESDLQEKSRNPRPAEASPVQTKQVSDSDAQQHTSTISNRNEKEDETVYDAINPDQDYFSESEKKLCEKIYGGDKKSERPSHSNRKIEWTEGSFIGSGSYGTVVIGLEKKSGNLMAVKKVLVEEIDGKNKDKVDALMHEISFYERLSNDNIVRYIGFEKGQDSFNIFLEYVDGGSLQTMINKFGPLEEEVVRQYTRQILKGLRYLHYNEVIHGDLKAANVLVDRKGTCKLADLGTAKMVREIKSDANSLKGTVHWMAPEVIRQLKYDRHADIWSLGCTVYEMVAGHPPWHDHKTIFAVMNTVVKTDKLPELPDRVSPECQDFIYSCLKRNPNERKNVCQLLKHSFIKNEKKTKKSEDKSIDFGADQDQKESEDPKEKYKFFDLKSEANKYRKEIEEDYQEGTDIHIEIPFVMYDCSGGPGAMEDRGDSTRAEPKDSSRKNKPPLPSARKNNSDHTLTTEGDQHTPFSRSSNRGFSSSKCFGPQATGRVKLKLKSSESTTALSLQITGLGPVRSQQCESGHQRDCDTEEFDFGHSEPSKQVSVQNFKMKLQIQSNRIPKISQPRFTKPADASASPQKRGLMSVPKPPRSSHPTPEDRQPGTGATVRGITASHSGFFGGLPPTTDKPAKKAGGQPVRFADMDG